MSKLTESDRSTKDARKRVVERLEEVQNTRLTPVQGRRLFRDEAGKHYLVFCGGGTWHGISQSSLPTVREAGDGALVVAKKYKTRIDVCIGALGEFVKNLGRLPQKKDGAATFHITVEEDGLSVDEIPGYFLNTAFHIPLGGANSHEERLRKIGRIINIKVQEPETVSHADAQAKLILVGSYLGYRTFTPDRSQASAYGALGELCSESSVPDDYLGKKKIEEIKHIDVIWFNGDGLPTHGFEVEHSTDVTKGLLRLYQASGISIKMFVIAQEETRGRFERERQKAPFRQIRDKYIFKNYRELDEFFESVKQSSNLRKKFMNEDG